MGPPAKLMLEMQNMYKINNFVETGTYYGNTARWASNFFKVVDTIEFSESIYKQAVEKYGHIENINFIYGNSIEKLNEIIRKDVACIFWLDAHWCDGETFGIKDQCPLVKEIEIINESKTDNFIFIDDARFFLSPYMSGNWPNISTLLNNLHVVKNRCVVIIEDVIIAVPKYAEPIVTQYCLEVNSRSWEEHVRNIKRKKHYKSRLRYFVKLIFPAK